MTEVIGLELFLTSGSPSSPLTMFTHLYHKCPHVLLISFLFMFGQFFAVREDEVYHDQ